MPNNKDNYYLYIDFGATRIKWVLEKKSSRIIRNGEIENPYINLWSKVEIDVKILFQRIKLLIESLVNRYNISNILISSQMHGFALQNSNGEVITNYISWMDQRFVNNSYKKYEYIKQNYSELFLMKTGMPIKSGIPFFNSIEAIKNCNTKSAKLLSLPELILILFGVSNPHVHITMAAGTGFYNVYEGTIIDEFLSIHRNMSGKKIIFNPISFDYMHFVIKINNKDIKLSIGYGDHQCAVLGAGNTVNTISLNLGTGSQVSQIVYRKNFDKMGFSDKIQVRPYFEKNQLLECITHIPSGRVLNQFISFFNNRSIKEIWNDIEKLNIIDLKKASMKIDLSIFPDSWNFKIEGGGIFFIKDGELTYRNAINSLIKSYGDQYINAIRIVEKRYRNKRDIIILSGGISKRIPVIKKYLKYSLNKKIKILKINQNIDETILGLKKIIIYEN